MDFRMQGIKLNTALSYIGGGALSHSVAARQSASPKTLVKFFKLYGEMRQEKHPLRELLFNCFDAIITNTRTKVFQNNEGKILAGYNYKIRHNKLEERSMYINALARNKSLEFNELSKEMMTSVYNDIKKTALAKKLKEITLFVFAGETNLRKNYERLGFKIDNKCDIKKVYLIRVRVDEFLKNEYFKLRQFKEAVGVDSILKYKHPN